MILLKNSAESMGWMLLKWHKTDKRMLIRDGETIKVANSEPANMFVYREYRSGWELGQVVMRKVLC